MFCGKCGKPLEAGGKFCGFCGSQTADVLQTNNIPAINIPAVSPKKSRKGVIIAVVIVLAFMGLGVGGFFLLEPLNEDGLLSTFAPELPFLRIAPPLLSPETDSQELPATDGYTTPSYELTPAPYLTLDEIFEPEPMPTADRRTELLGSWIGTFDSGNRLWGLEVSVSMINADYEATILYFDDVHNRTQMVAHYLADVRFDPVTDRFVLSYFHVYFRPDGWDSDVVLYGTINDNVFFGNFSTDGTATLTRAAAGPPAVEPPPPPAAPQLTYPALYTTTSNLHLRAEPTTQSYSFGVVWEGTPIQVLAPADDEWYHVFISEALTIHGEWIINQHGFMAAEFLSR